MLACPACGLETPDGSTECPRCHLATGLFDAVKEAAGDAPNADPKYLQTIGEILTQLGDSAPTTPPATDGPGRVMFPLRFPAPAPPGAVTTGTPVATPRPVSTLPALPAAGAVPMLLRQVNDYLQLGRRQGLNLTAFTERTRAALLAQDRVTLEALSRDLFVHLAATLTDEYEGAVMRRNELAGLTSTSTPDVELEGCRASLALGDLSGAQRRLRHVEESLSELEEQWAAAQILVTESDLLAATIRELGGDPRPALGPLVEGRRRAREGDRAGAEPVLARATLALWSILNPMFQRELAGIKDQLLKQHAAGEKVAIAVQSLRQLADDLRHRNFASAVLTYRQLKAVAEGGEAAVRGSSEPALSSDDPSTIS